VDARRGARRLPCVLPDIGEVTVGGTLSAGGFGTTSHRYGAQVGQVEQLDVVTGTGERVRCSATRNVELFDAVRSGQGQFGIITEAWIRLRRAGGRFRQYELHYRDAERFADALERIVEADRFDHLRAEFRNDENLIVLNAGIEYDVEPDDGILLATLEHDEHAYTRDTASVGRAVVLQPAALAPVAGLDPALGDAADAACRAVAGFAGGAAPALELDRPLPDRQGGDRRPAIHASARGTGDLVFDPRQTG